MQVRSGTVAILRYHNALTTTDPDHQEPLFGYQLIGAVLAPLPDGTLSNAVIWLLRRITPANGTTTMQVMHDQGLTITSSTGTFSMVEGRLDRSLLRPIAEALAAVVAWGAWTAPDPFETPVAAGSGFRKLTRKSAFKKAETRGQIAGVHVLAAREPSIRYSTDTTPTGRTMAPHYRAGHWQRYRVGSRNNWTYQRKTQATSDRQRWRPRRPREPGPYLPAPTATAARLTPSHRFGSRLVAHSLNPSKAPGGQARWP